MDVKLEEDSDSDLDFQGDLRRAINCSLQVEVGQCLDHWGVL